MSGTFDPYHTWLGIPPEDQPPSYYRLLGLKAFEDDADVIEHAADQRMAHLRSFQSGRRAAASQRLLNEVAGAKLCLLQRPKKEAYDRQLRRKLQKQRSEAGTAEAGAAGAATPPGAADEAADVLAPLSQFLDKVRSEPNLSGVSGRTRRSSRSGVHAPPPAPKSPTGRIVLLGSVGLGVTVLAVAVVLAIAASWGSSEQSGLVFDWPEESRAEATLEIDGQPVAVRPTGPLTHPCPPGEVRVRIARPGFWPYEETVEVRDGQPAVVAPVLVPSVRLIIPWPAGDRGRGLLEIDGRPHDVRGLAGGEDE